ncbi:MAG TPA: hypothetical protein PK926_08750 [Spirochaetota bacterium]|nr:hypothetical protein [Spirochaetota bacterium]HPI88622.1 hypothetical protein [Spirochaetota bacterium]HPR48263.1 hypothetical protein [Spirochaetota bacterium]
MELQKEIASLCLYGFIKEEKGAERDQCLRAIRLVYGNDIAQKVKSHFKD